MGHSVPVGTNLYVAKKFGRVGSHWGGTNEEAGPNPDSIPPSDRRWLLVTRSADFADVGPTLGRR